VENISKDITRITRVKRNNDIIDLSTNEAAYGKYKKYPDTVLLKEKIADKKQVSVENILLTRGSEEGISFIFNKFLKEGDKIIRPEPTFGMLEVYENISKVKVDKINYNKSLKVNILNSLSEKHKLLYIANPDNPTGKYNTEINLILQRCKELNIKVILDIVYLSYSFVKDLNYERNLIEEYDNLFIVNSFSKVHGLAGIRSGYILSNKDNIKKLEILSPMQEVNSVAVKETIEAIQNENIFYKNIKNANKWKKHFQKYFSEYYIETETNFMLFKTDKSEEIYKSLMDKKIKVKILSGHPSIEGLLRITIGNDIVMKTIFKIMLEKIDD